MMPTQRRDAIAAILGQMVPPDHRFFFIAIPIVECVGPAEGVSDTLESVPNKQQLGKVLRKCANFYDPQN